MRGREERGPAERGKKEEGRRVREREMKGGDSGEEGRGGSAEGKLKGVVEGEAAERQVDYLDLRRVQIIYIYSF